MLVSKQLTEARTSGWTATGCAPGITHGAFWVGFILQGIIAGLVHGTLIGPGNPGSRGQNVM